MILAPQLWHDLYSGIREDAHQSNEKKISIFVCGIDCDSLCALKILQAILMSSHLSFSTFVTSAQDQLHKALAEEFGKGVRDYRTAFCINCGANSDVSQLLGSLGDDAKHYVRLVFIDSNRPIHHSLNDDSDSSCVLLHDPDSGDVSLDSIPVSDVRVDENTGPPVARRRLDFSGAATDESEEREAALHEYYSQGSQYGVPASVVLFQLAHSMQLGCSYLLWMAILGLTEQFMLNRADEAVPHYASSLEQLQNYAEAMNVSDRNQELFGEGFEDDEDSRTGEEGGLVDQGMSGQDSVCLQPRRSEESKLVLHRHWSLVDSMTHTPDVMAHLETFREGNNGRQQLFGVLATAGIPVQQATLQYAQMKVQYKTKAVFDLLLQELRTAVAAKILYKDGVEDNKKRKEDDVTFEMLYRSFIVEFSSHLTLSAADHVHILWAHLQHTSQNLCSRTDEGFWEAYKALDIRNKQVTAGLGLAIKQHRQLLQDVSMADPKQARADHIMSEGIGGPGQCLDLSTHDAWASTSPLVHPISLWRFGRVMQKMDSRKSSEWVYRPLVAVGPPDSEHQCQVLALPGQKKPQKHPVDRTIMYCSHNGILNVYGSAHGLLALAVEASKVYSAKHFCDSSVLTMHKHDVDLFLESLSQVYSEVDQARFSKEGILALLETA